MQLVYFKATDSAGKEHKGNTMFYDEACIESMLDVIAKEFNTTVDSVIICNIMNVKSYQENRRGYHKHD